MVFLAQRGSAGVRGASDGASAKAEPDLRRHGRVLCGVDAAGVSLMVPQAGEKMSNQIKAVFFDVDGTLLSHKQNDVPPAPAERWLSFAPEACKRWLRPDGI